jgi:hypothetical protein
MRIKKPSIAYVFCFIDLLTDFLKGGTAGGTAEVGGGEG